jgi:hypothetical protein
MSNEVVMSIRQGSFGAALVAAACTTVSACGPLRLDATPQIRGTLVTVDGSTVGIRHKTGRTYHVEVTRETLIVNRTRPRDISLCPGQSATVFLVEPRQFTASSITLWSDRCSKPQASKLTVTSDEPSRPQHADSHRGHTWLPLLYHRRHV